MTKEEFVTLNPERHGYDDTGRCQVCGDKSLPKHIFCPYHHTDWDDSTFTVTPFPHEWALSHSDFNGNNGEILVPCPNCSHRFNVDGDYICRHCRSLQA